MGEGHDKCVHPVLIQSLCDPAVYTHPTEDIRVVETHISWLILTGPYAYKIKKPVSLGFADFSTLAKRKRFCAEELRLNQRLSPDLYIGVVPISGSEVRPRLDDDGEVIEYAVKMIQFETGSELDLLLDKGRIGVDHISALAQEVAEFHRTVAVAGADSPYGSIDAIRRRILDNFEDIVPCLDSAAIDEFSGLEDWVGDNLRAKQDMLNARKQDGFVRECHGDMHLANMMLMGNRIRLFDCLEFNADLRWIDVISEVAFAVMDLEYRRRPDLASQFVNSYLSASGDYSGLALLPLYLVYRAMVRAKVACIRARQSGRGGTGTTAVYDHLLLARTYAHPPPARVIITRGVSGSGKSWLAMQIARLLPAIHIRSDVERDRDSVQSEDARDRYSAERIDRVYTRLLSLADMIINAGFSVIVDATFLRRDQRRPFLRLAAECGVPAHVLDLQCPETVLQERVTQRLAEGRDPSEATLEVLATQLRTVEPLSPEEVANAIPVDAGDEVDAAALVENILSWSGPAAA